MIFLSFDKLKNLNNSSTAVYKQIYLTVDDLKRQRFFIGQRNKRLSEITDKKTIEKLSKEVEIINNQAKPTSPGNNLNYTPEDVDNKSTNVILDNSSDIKYPSVKSVYTWVLSLGYLTISSLSGYATQAWVNSQGFITNVLSALGYTPENITNKENSVIDTSTTKYPTVNLLKTGLDAKQNVLTNPVTGTGTNNEIAAFTGATTIGSLTTATYPSLTELSYVKGVTSAIQTQLNAKQASLGFTPENVANKETTALDTSTTKYPCNNVVKTAIEAHSGGAVSTSDLTNSNNATPTVSSQLKVAISGSATYLVEFSGRMVATNASGLRLGISMPSNTTVYYELLSNNSATNNIQSNNGSFTSTSQIVQTISAAANTNLLFKIKCTVVITSGSGDLAIQVAIAGSGYDGKILKGSRVQWVKL